MMRQQHVRPARAPIAIKSAGSARATFRICSGASPNSTRGSIFKRGATFRHRFDEANPRCMLQDRPVRVVAGHRVDHVQDGHPGLEGLRQGHGVFRGMLGRTAKVGGKQDAPEDRPVRLTLFWTGSGIAVAGQPDRQHRAIHVTENQLRRRAHQPGAARKACRDCPRRSDRRPRLARTAPARTLDRRPQVSVFEQHLVRHVPQALRGQHLSMARSAAWRCSW